MIVCAKVGGGKRVEYSRWWETETVLVLDFGWAISVRAIDCAEAGGLGAVENRVWQRVAANCRARTDTQAFDDEKA